MKTIHMTDELYNKIVELQKEIEECDEYSSEFTFKCFSVILKIDTKVYNNCITPEQLKYDQEYCSDQAIAAGECC